MDEGMMLSDNSLQLVCRCLNIRIKALSDPVPPPPLPTESAAISVTSNNLGADPRLELLPEVSIQSLKLSQDEAQDPFFSTVVAVTAMESTTTGTVSTTVTPTSVSTPVVSSPAAATVATGKITDDKHVSCHRLVSVVPVVGGEQLPMARNYATEMLPVLVHRRDAGRFVVHICLICGQMGFAEGPYGQLLVNTGTLISNQTVIAGLKQSPNYCPVFGVLLPKATDLPPMIQTGVAQAPNRTTVQPPPLSNFSTLSSNLSSQRVQKTNSISALPDGRSQCTQQIQALVSNYLKREQSAMEERIRQVVEQETKAFDELKQRVKEQRGTVMNIMLQNAELIGLEDEVDSAVPLSPYSFHSGDPSPNPVMTVGVSAAAVSRSLAAKGAPNNYQQQQQYGNILNGTNAVLNGWSPTMEQRPKAFSNPANMYGWKRKRHSGGSGRPRGLPRTAEEPDVFSFDQDDMAAFCQSSDDDAAFETDDSGNGGEEYYSKLYPNETIVQRMDEGPILEPPAPKIPAIGNLSDLTFGTSLPVQIPFKGGITAFHSSSEEEEQQRDMQYHHKDPAAMAESFKQLALSVHPADHPERLFGDRPTTRRRYKTGEIVRDQLFIGTKVSAAI